MVKPHQEVVMGKAKLNKKLTSLILILALVATIIPTSVYGNLLVSKNTKTLKTAKAVRMAAVDSAAGGSEAADEAYISKLAIISKNGTVWGEGIETMHTALQQKPMHGQQMI